MSAPDTWVEWVRFCNALLGLAAFALIVWRLVGRWPLSDWLDRSVLMLLGGAVLVLSLGAARAAQLGVRFNELAWAALAVNVGTVVVGIVWHRLRRWPRRKTRRADDRRK